MCKFESSQKDESRWQSTDSSKAYRNTSAFKYHINLIAEKQSSRENFSFSTSDCDFGEGSWF